MPVLPVLVVIFYFIPDEIEVNSTCHATTYNFSPLKQSIIISKIHEYTNSYNNQYVNKLLHTFACVKCIER